MVPPLDQAKCHRPKDFREAAVKSRPWRREELNLECPSAGDTPHARLNLDPPTPSKDDRQEERIHFPADHKPSRRPSAHSAGHEEEEAALQTAAAVATKNPEHHQPQEDSCTSPPQVVGNEPGRASPHSPHEGAGARAAATETGWRDLFRCNAGHPARRRRQDTKPRYLGPKLPASERSTVFSTSRRQDGRRRRRRPLPPCNIPVFITIKGGGVKIYNPNS